MDRRVVEVGGGGTTWDGLTYDPELNLLYVGTGNGSPWPRELRSPGGGDNLFLCSIIALDADSGAYRWHYQAVPAESWDYDCVQQMTLAELTVGGQPRKVLMQAGKNGFFYVIDRTNGKLISANNFVPVNWASGIDLAHRPAGGNGSGILRGRAGAPGVARCLRRSLLARHVVQSAHRFRLHPGRRRLVPLFARA